MHITFRRREPQVTPFHGFQHVLILKCTCWILQVRVHHLSHLIIIYAVNDDVHTCTVRQVDVVDFLPWAFLHTKTQVHLYLTAYVLMIDRMCPYA